MGELDRLPPKLRPPFYWVWLTMMVLALMVAVGSAFFR